MTVQVLQVGLDESGYGQTGTHEAFIFAGYVGPITHVEAFTHVWDEILNRAPAMSVSELKKKIRWRHSIDPKIRLLSAAVHLCHLHGVRFKVAPNDHLEMMNALIAAFPKGDRRIQNLGFGNPWFFAFMSILLNLIAEIWDEPDTKIEVIYDENLKEARKLKQGYAAFRKFAEIAAPQFLDKLAKDPGECPLRCWN